MIDPRYEHLFGPVTQFLSQEEPEKGTFPLKDGTGMELILRRNKENGGGEAVIASFQFMVLAYPHTISAVSGTSYIEKGAIPGPKAFLESVMQGVNSARHEFLMRFISRGQDGEIPGEFAALKKLFIEDDQERVKGEVIAAAGRLARWNKDTVYITLSGHMRLVSEWDEEAERIFLFVELGLSGQKVALGTMSAKQDEAFYVAFLNHVVVDAPSYANLWADNLNLAEQHHRDEADDHKALAERCRMDSLAAADYAMLYEGFPNA